MDTITEQTIHFPLHAVYGPDGLLVAAFPTREAAEAYSDRRHFGEDE